MSLYRAMHSSQFENNYFTEICSGSEAGSYLRFIDIVYHSTLGLRVKKKRKYRANINKYHNYMSLCRTTTNFYHEIKWTDVRNTVCRW